MARSLRTTVLALAASQIAHAGLVAHREPTPFAKPQPDPVNGWSPNPTRGPELVFGSMDDNQLFGRKENTQLTDAHICGWVSGLSQSPLSCPNGGGTTSACGYLVEYGSPYNVWCCEYTSSASGAALTANFDSCPWITLCLPYTDSANSNTYSQIIRDTSSHVISCPSQAPECTTIFLQGPSTDIYFQYGCGTEATTYSAYQSYTVEAAVTTTTSSSRTSSVTSTNTGSSTSITTSATSSPTDSGSSTNVGAIAGGTVGGVAAVAIIAGIIGWLVYRKKAARRPAMREVSQYTGSTFGGSTMAGGSTYGGPEVQSVAPSTRK